MFVVTGFVSQQGWFGNLDGHGGQASLAHGGCAVKATTKPLAKRAKPKPPRTKAAPFMLTIANR